MNFHPVSLVVALALTIACQTSTPANVQTTETAVGTPPNALPTPAAVSGGTETRPGASHSSEANVDGVSVNAGAQRTYAVFGVGHNDVLNVRAAPDPKSAKVFSFGPSVSKVTSTGKSTVVNDTPWIEVNFNGGIGWVNRRFLTEVVKGGGCNDPALTAAIRKLMRSVDSADGAALAELVSEMRGLSVRYSRWDSGANIPSNEVGSLYSGAKVRTWGMPEMEQQGPYKGTFRDMIYRDFKNGVSGKGAKEKCGEVLIGGSAGMPDWPTSLSGLTPVSFHYPGTETGTPWHTTVAGFEYVDGKPYLAALVGYRWEI